MSNFIHLKSVITPSIITELHQRAEETIISIYQDYFLAKSLFDFQKTYLFHGESVVMQMATNRFVSAAILSKLRRLVKPHLASICEEINFLLHPVSYLRFNLPETYYSEQHKNAFLSTEPHYDHFQIREFNIPALTVWLPLEEINQESGGICIFSTKEVIDYFSTPSGGSRYDYESYLKLSPEIDPILKQDALTFNLSKGDIIAFGANVLHGGTKPRSRQRVSFDFRLIPISNIQNTSKFVDKYFDELNSAYDMYLANNLIHLGDFLGASRILKMISKATGNRDLQRVAAALANRPPDPVIYQQGVKI